VGIELKATLKTRKLLILLNEKNAKNTGFAQVRYTAGTRAQLVSKALSASTKVESWALAESDFVDLPFVKAVKSVALALPLHLLWRGKGLLARSISPRRGLFLECG
jgi:hypothetical protein